MNNNFRAIFNLLQSQINIQKRWVYSDRFEIFMGAILTQNTAWTNVERVLDQLKNAHVFDAPSILACADLENLIRPAGFFRTKSVYLQNAARWFLEHDAKAHTLETPNLRQSLLKVRGIGEESADDILLYGYHRAIFVWDAYTRKMLSRCGFGEFRTYRAARNAFSDALEGFSVSELTLFHELIVQAGKIDFAPLKSFKRLSVN